MSVPVELQRFFDTAVIVDDKLTDLAAGKSEDETNPARTLFRTFQEGGIVVSPFLFNNRESSAEMVIRAVQVIRPAKLVILDWHLHEMASQTDDLDMLDLENSSGLLAGVVRGETDAKSVAAKEIIRLVLEDKESGMKYFVIYTDNTESATPKSLLTYLQTQWADRTDLDILRNEVDTLLRELSEIERNRRTVDVTKPFMVGRLFITFMKKGDPVPAELFARFLQQVQSLSGPFALAVLDAVALLERDAYRAIADFSKPLELPVFMHIHNNGLSSRELNSFVSTLIRDFILENPGDEAALPSEISKHRLKLLKDCAAFYREKKTLFQEWENGLKALGLTSLGTVKWEPVFDHLTSCTTLDEVLQSLNHDQKALRPVFLTDPSNSNWETLQFAVEHMAAYVAWRRLHSDQGLLDFMDAYRAQNVLFTRLLKYIHMREPSTVHTGAIYRGTGNNKGKFLLCITPFCDTARPQKVDFRYKFLVGVSSPFTKELVKGDEKKEELESSRHVTFLPCSEGGRDTLELVQWNFYDTQVLSLQPSARFLYEWRMKNYDPGYILTQFGESNVPPAGIALSRSAQTAIIRILQDAPGFAVAQVEIMKSIAAGAEEPAAETVDLLGEAKKVSLEQAKRDVLREWVPFAGYSYVATLKREYVQQIMNKYLVYHSRAGVSELYFKERPSVYLKLGLK